MPMPSWERTVCRRHASFRSGKSARKCAPHFLHIIAPEALQELPDLELVRPNPLHGRQCAMQDMIQPAVLICPLDRNHVEWLLHHADACRIPLWVRTDLARALLGDIEALR